MPLNHDEIVYVVQEICTRKDLNVTVTESMKAGATVGVCTATGGVLGGIVGVGIGSLIGTALAIMNGRGKFKSVFTVINEMSPNQKEELAISMRKIFENIDAQDVIRAVTLIMASNSLQDMVLRELGGYLKGQGLKLM